MYNQDDLWDVRTLMAFNQLNYDKMLTASNLLGNEQCIKLSRDSLDFIDGFEAHKLHKNSTVKKTYFVPTLYAQQMPILIIPEALRKVRYQSKVYNLLTNATSIKITPERILSFRRLVDESGLTTHTKPDHYTTYKIIVLTARLGKLCARVVTESAFGKDKYIEMVRLLMNGTTVLTDPTIAKLINRIQHDKFVVISEMPGVMSGEPFSQLCNAFITIGDDRQVLDNRARATRGTTESAVISNKSVLFIHNPRKYYTDKGKQGFEDIYPYNVINRYFMVNLLGYTETRFTENLDNMEYCNEFSSVLKDWVKSALWYEEHWHTLKNERGIDWERFNFPKHEERFKVNFERIALAVSHYAESDEEYLSMLKLLYNQHLELKYEIQDEPFKEGRLN